MNPNDNPDSSESSPLKKYQICEKLLNAELDRSKLSEELKKDPAIREIVSSLILSREDMREKLSRAVEEIKKFKTKKSKDETPGPTNVMIDQSTSSGLTSPKYKKKTCEKLLNIELEDSQLPDEVKKNSAMRNIVNKLIKSREEANEELKRAREERRNKLKEFGQRIYELEYKESVSVAFLKLEKKKIKDTLGQFVRRSFCPKALLHAIETFTLRYSMISVDDINRRQTELHTKILKLLGPTSQQNEDDENLNNLSKLSLAMSDDSQKLFETPEEIRYAEDAIQIGEVFKESTSNQYKICYWTLYMSSHRDIHDLLHQIQSEWSNMDRATRVHLYCEKFAHLFDHLSKVQNYGPELKIPENCSDHDPTDKEFEYYLNHLGHTVRDDELCFVAGTLCGVKWNYTLSKEWYYI